MLSRVARQVGRPIALLLALLLLTARPGPGAAQEADGSLRPNLPRYVSLKTDEVNLRSGPGVKFPIDWVLKRRNMPVEVLQEFEHWRKVRDWQGTEGWVHQSMTSGKRYGVITGQVRTLRQKPEREAGLAAQVEAGVVAQILECKDQWCRLDAGGQRGWLTRTEFWGVYPDETLK
jgi:SH3-like domain-containing protein